MIGGVEPCSFIDYPGHLATVVFTSGCNLRCRYCHNPRLCSYDARDAVSIPALMRLLESRRGKLQAVVVSGGEPCVQSALAPLLRQIRARGFSVKLDTNGTHPSVVRRLLDERLVDYVAVDVKVAPGTDSRWLCDAPGQAELALETLRHIVAARVPCEARTTVIGDHHTVLTLGTIARALAATSVRVWRLQPLRCAVMLDANAGVTPPDARTLSAAIAAAAALGVHAMVRGNTRLGHAAPVVDCAS